MDYQILTSVVTDGVATVTISRPQALNALNTQFFHEMDSMAAELAANPEVRVMVITGEGKAFVAGADIAEMVHKNQDEGSAFSRLGQNTFRSLEKLPFPVIAAINGFALGGGLELAMACDFRIASSKARFGQPEVNLGLIPGYAGTQRLSRLTGLADALLLLLTGEMIGAEEALRIGLVQKVLEPEQLMPEVMRIAKLIAAKGPKAVQKVKKITRMGYGMDFDQGSSLEAIEFGSLFGPGSEGEEGMKAFLEKRQPNW
ncbi:MAG: enoyl-CoA hydratase/isomerase family protein [Bacteroidetes bacterium]|nr:enoyl-CoA hydratase/isomerase family protein [Bacteroidales bacterium]MBU1008617.1 enoyl-CoA hydratase/isomerase family protein [Bacteroidota bacterium]